MYLNGNHISDYGGVVEQGFTVSGVSVDSNHTQGAGNSSFVLLKQTFGLKKIEIPVVFSGESADETRTKYSRFCMDAVRDKLVELVLSEGRQYTAFLNSIGTEKWLTPNDMAVTFGFVGYCHGILQTVAANTIYCMSTLPHTDCKITVTASQDYATYKVGTVTFSDVHAGDVLVVDGLDKRILINGAPAAQKAEWIRFPSLVPGENIITCNDTVTVEYYPVYF